MVYFAIQSNLPYLTFPPRGSLIHSEMDILDRDSLHSTAHTYV